MKVCNLKMLNLLFVVVFMSSFMLQVDADAQRGIARGAAGGALGGAAVSSLSGGSAGKGAAWGAGIGAVRGIAQEDRARQEERIRDAEMREAYEAGRRDGSRVDYRSQSDRKYADEMSY